MSKTLTQTNVNELLKGLYLTLNADTQKEKDLVLECINTTFKGETTLDFVVRYNQERLKLKL